MSWYSLLCSAWWQQFNTRHTLHRWWPTNKPASSQVNRRCQGRGQGPPEAYILAVSFAPPCARARARAHAHTHARTHTRTHTRTHAHTRTHMRCTCASGGAKKGEAHHHFWGPPVQRVCQLTPKFRFSSQHMTPSAVIISYLARFAPVERVLNGGRVDFVRLAATTAARGVGKCGRAAAPTRSRETPAPPRPAPHRLLLLRRPVPRLHTYTASS